MKTYFSTVCTNHSSIYHLPKNQINNKNEIKCVIFSIWHTYITSNWGWGNHNKLFEQISSIHLGCPVLCFRKNFIFFLVSKMVYNMLDMCNVSLFVFMVYTCEVNICNPNLCFRVKVCSAYYGRYCTCRATWYEKPKVLEKESQQITIIRFLNDKISLLIRSKFSFVYLYTLVVRMLRM